MTEKLPKWSSRRALSTACPGWTCWDVFKTAGGERALNALERSCDCEIQPNQSESCNSVPARTWRPLWLFGLVTADTLLALHFLMDSCIPLEFNHNLFFYFQWLTLNVWPLQPSPHVTSSFYVSLKHLINSRRRQMSRNVFHKAFRIFQAEIAAKKGENNCKQLQQRTDTIRPCISCNLLNCNYSRVDVRVGVRHLVRLSCGSH